MGATPVLSPTTIPYSERKAMKWTLVLLNSTLPRTIQWTPPYARPPPPPPQLFLTANTVSAKEWTFILVGLHRIPCAAPYSYSLRRSPFEWNPPYSVRLSGLHPTLCATPQLHSNLLCTIEWNPPYPLCYAPQLFHTANSVNHGVDPLINTLHATLYD